MIKFASGERPRARVGSDAETTTGAYSGDQSASDRDRILSGDRGTTFGTEKKVFLK